MSTIRPPRSEDTAAGTHAARPVGRRARLRRDPVADRGRRARSGLAARPGRSGRPPRHLPRLGARSVTSAGGRRARRLRGQPGVFRRGGSSRRRAPTARGETRTRAGDRAAGGRPLHRRGSRIDADDDRGRGRGAHVGRGATMPAVPSTSRSRMRRRTRPSRSCSTRSGSPTSAGGCWPSGAGRRDGRIDDVEEHREILLALEDGDSERAARLMSAHVESAVRHWSPRDLVGPVERRVSRARARPCAPTARWSAPSASSIFALSSPEAKSSSVISAPPINSPLTNTCGIVGHSLSAVSSWRMRGSGSTSTPVIGAPACHNACSARIELPHAGASGVPFMKTTTGSVSMTCLIWSCKVLMQSPSFGCEARGWFRRRAAPPARH